MTKTLRVRALSDAAQDLRDSWRTTWQRPGFTIVAAITLALGIGANSAIFNLVDVVLLQTLPVDRPDRLVLIQQVMSRGGTQNVSRPLFEQLCQEHGAFAGVLAAEDGVTSVNIGRLPEGAAQTASVQAVSGEYFQVLGTPPLLGRSFTLEDDRVAGGHSPS